MRHFILAVVLGLAAPSLAAAQVFDADRNARITVDPQGVQAGGSSEARPTPDSTILRSVQQGVSDGGGAADSVPVNQGTPSAVVNQIPRRAVSSEGNPR